MLMSLTVNEKKEGPISHALQMREATNLNNYHSWFILYRKTPNKVNFFLFIVSFFIQQHFLVFF